MDSLKRELSVSEPLQLDKKIYASGLWSKIYTGMQPRWPEELILLIETSAREEIDKEPQ